jgi:hypothetical protein
MKRKKTKTVRVKAVPKAALKVAHVPQPTPLPDLAAAISTEHAASVAASSSALEHARQAGEHLLEAKARIDHGEWLPWLQKNCPTVALRTAQNYMLIASNWGRIESAKTQRVAYLPVRAALAILAQAKDDGDLDGDPTRLAPGGNANEPVGFVTNRGGTEPSRPSATTSKYLQPLKLSFDVQTYNTFMEMVRDLKEVFTARPDLDAVVAPPVTSSDVVLAAVRYAHLTLVEDKEQE